MQSELDRLLRLRLVVARFGEMDVAKWWNTKGQLGPLGRAALSRGFPRTHRFARARSVFAVASHRCKEVFEAPESVTLWALPAAMEEDFEAAWEHWLNDDAEWNDFFDNVESWKFDGLADSLRELDLVTDSDVQRVDSLQTSAEGRAVPIAETFGGAPEQIALLALGFARGVPGSLTVPYMEAPSSQ